MQRSVVNKTEKQHLTKQQLYGHLFSISQTIQIRTRHMGLLLEKQRRTLKRCSLVGFYTWTWKCRRVCKDFHQHFADPGWSLAERSAIYVYLWNILRKAYNMYIFYILLVFIQFLFIRDFFKTLVHLYI